MLNTTQKKNTHINVKHNTEEKKPHINVKHNTEEKLTDKC
jgi:hypothetical protein